ncbi:MAG: HIT domain-containing protein [Candidatus Thermoplasmatota archaeon]
MHEVLFAPSRGAYVGKQKPISECLLCAIRDKDTRVWTRLVYQDKHIIVLMNIFPYSPGHLQVVPTTHVKELEELSKQELEYFLDFTQKATKFVKNLMAPQGFNIGINLGKAGGASIEHLHAQIVPRYKGKPSYEDQAAIHKLYLDNVNLLKESYRSKGLKSACKCPTPKYILKRNPTVYLHPNPYNRGHVVIQSEKHVEFENIDLSEFLKIFVTTIELKKVIEEIYSPAGFNLGMNIGEVPNSSEHLQLHLVPRYVPESGFMEVIGNTRVIIESLEQTYEKIKKILSSWRAF